MPDRMRPWGRRNGWRWHSSDCAQTIDTHEVSATESSGVPNAPHSGARGFTAMFSFSGVYRRLSTGTLARSANKGQQNPKNAGWHTRRMRQRRITPRVVNAGRPTMGASKTALFMALAVLTSWWAEPAPARQIAQSFHC